MMVEQLNLSIANWVWDPKCGMPTLVTSNALGWSLKNAKIGTHGCVDFGEPTRVLLIELGRKGGCYRLKDQRLLENWHIVQ